MDIKREFVNGKMQTYIEKRCLWCDRIYRAKIQRQKFCSDRCKKAESYARLYAKNEEIKPTKAQRRKINEDTAKIALLNAFMLENGAFDPAEYAQRNKKTTIKFIHTDSHSGYWGKVAQ